jgi:hypothetical protein
MFVDMRARAFPGNVGTMLRIEETFERCIGNVRRVNVRMGECMRIWVDGGLEILEGTSGHLCRGTPAQMCATS